MYKSTNSKNPWRESAVERKQQSNFEIKNLISLEEKPDDKNRLFKKKESATFFG
jgi:hypothetical protein